MKDLFKGKLFPLFAGFARLPVLPHPKQRKHDEKRRNHGDNQRDSSVCRLRAAADCPGSRGKNGNQDSSQRSADSRKQGGAGGKPVPHIGVRAKGRNHSPVGNIAHGISDAESKIHQRKKTHEPPTGKPYVKKQINHHCGGHPTRRQPGLEFAESGTGPFYDISHHRVVYGVEHPGGNHNSCNRPDLSPVKGMRKQHEGQQIAVNQTVNRIPPHCSQRKKYQILFGCFFILHCFYSPVILISSLFGMDGTAPFRDTATAAAIAALFMITSMASPFIRP